jgi:formylglycine-generating enzyme
MKKLIFSLLIAACACAPAFAQTMNVHIKGSAAPTTFQLANLDSVTFTSATQPPVVVGADGMIAIPAGTFSMGGNDLSNTGCGGDAGPKHSVTLTAFSMDKTEITQAKYKAIMGGLNPSGFTGDDNLPVEQVTYFDAIAFCNARSTAEGKQPVYSWTSATGTPGNGCSNLAGLTADFSKNGYRLPTEAEWEYACRAGCTNDYTTGPNNTLDGAYAWNGDPSAANAGTDPHTGGCNPGRTHPVATKLPNPWGLYDMIGNVLEMCNEMYGSYTSAAQTDPMGNTGGTFLLLKGGSWCWHQDMIPFNNYRAPYRTAAWSGYSRAHKFFAVGFRCVRR